MKSEQIEAITEKATEQLITALDAGHSETLKAYLKPSAAFIATACTTSCSSLRRSRMPVMSPDSGLGINWAVPSRRARRESSFSLPCFAGQKNRTKNRQRVLPPWLASAQPMCSTSPRPMAKSCRRWEPFRAIPRDRTLQLQAFAKAQGISLEYSGQIAPARGVSYGGKVVLLPGQTPAEEFSTLTHELAHELLHRGERRSATSKRIRETEAEATAFVVTSAIGLETGSASSDYIQIWNGDAAVLTESLSFIRQAASLLLEALTDE
jgi:hypothetical protein